MNLTRRAFLGIVPGAAVTALAVACNDGPPDVAIATSTPLAATPAPTATTPAPTATPLAPLNVDLHVLVNKEYALPADYVPPGLQVLPGSWHAPEVGLLELRGDVVDALLPMFEAASADGVELRIRSAYRSYAEQERTFAYWVDVMGLEQARRESAEAGHSEHQLGTTMDFASAENGWELVESFAETAPGKWLAENAYRFGFALSYPRDGEPITGYIFEPWHYRYVGREAAEAWQRSRLTLIEFLEEIGGTPFGQSG